MSANYDFQREKVGKYNGYVLNVGCKEDPAKLSAIATNITNLDLQTYDKFTGTDVTGLRGFVKADFFHWTPPFEYDTVVLGEFLEHCDVPAFHRTLKKCYEVTKQDGVLIVTTPFDPRPKESQYGSNADKYFEIAEGVVSWHQLLIDDKMVLNGIMDAGFTLVEYSIARWTDRTFWHMVLAIKH